MFGTSGVRGPVGTDVTASLALDIGRAVGATADRVVLGRDARDSGRALLSALEAGLVESGTDCIKLGTVATPTLARAIARHDASAGIIVTASHNPPEDNGIKLWTPSGQAFDTTAQNAIEARIETSSFDLTSWDEHGSVTHDTSATDAHTDALTSYIDAANADLSDLSVVVDLGNGMGQVTADALFQAGADVETLNGQPDGRFPGRPSEPTAKTTATLQAHVRATDADLGIAHDGDADRMMAVTDTGDFVAGDLLLATFAREIASDGDRVAAPVDTSLAVDDALSAIGASVVRTRVGDVYVAEKTREPDVSFGGEPSGAWIFPEQTYCPDGPLAAVTLTVLAATQPLSERLASIDTYPILRDSIEVANKYDVMETIAKTVKSRYDDVTTIDGVRVGVADGWFLIRASGTQPIIRLTAESRDGDRTVEILEEARSILDSTME